MVDRFTDLKKFEKYLDGCSVDQLRDISRGIDRKTYPKRHELVVNRLNAKSSQLGFVVSEPSAKSGTISTWFESPSLKSQGYVFYFYIMAPLGILAFFWIISVSLAKWDYFKYRPWVSKDVLVALFCIQYLCLFFCGLFICKRLGIDILENFKSLRNFVSEFFRSILLVIPIKLSVGLAVLVASAIIHGKQTEHVLIRIAAGNPNSLVVLAWLFLAISIGPVIEEIFFRGFLYNALKTRISIGLSCIVQAAVFALYHQVGALESFAIFLSGLVFAAVYEVRKNLMAPTLLHCFWNALSIVPLLFIVIGNMYPVANSFDEARLHPSWLDSSSHPPEFIQRQNTGDEQVNYAIENWGSKGSREWKKEVNAFWAVTQWFPNDRKACARALRGMVAIYSRHLGDYRRAIVIADMLVEKYSDQREQCASAISDKGWSYYMIKEFGQSRDAFEVVIKKYDDCEYPVASAKKGLEWLTGLGK